MHEAVTNRTVDKILERTERHDSDTAYTKERQHTAQAATIHIEWKDGRRSDNFSWGHFVRANWRDMGENERIVMLFSDGAIEIEGHNLKPIEEEIREYKLNSIREMATAKQMLLNANPTGEPVISAIRAYPDVDEILREIKGEKRDQAGHAGRI